MHVARRLLADGMEVLGVDSLSDYYDVRLKQARLDVLAKRKRFRFLQVDLADEADLERLFSHDFDAVVHLAAQPGVRYSAANPSGTVRNNLVAFAALIEGCRRRGVTHFVYASSSSVYGANRRMPYSEHHGASHPLSLYAATKRSNELIAHAYSHLYGMPTTGLRLFTVYGPWGRPDMAPMLFADAILRGDPIDVFNEGRMERDFTYIDDVTEAIARLLAKTAEPCRAFDAHDPDPATSRAPWRVVNIGGHNPVALDAFIGALESALGKKAVRRLQPMQGGDVEATWADTHELEEAVHWAPRVSLSTGIGLFADWFCSYKASAQHGNLS